MRLNLNEINPTRLYTRKELIALLGISESGYSKKLASPGALPPSHVIPGGQVLYLGQDILDWVEWGRMRAAAPKLDYRHSFFLDSFSIGADSLTGTTEFQFAKGECVPQGRPGSPLKVVQDAAVQLGKAEWRGEDWKDSVIG